jgi:hypothetical protein
MRSVLLACAVLAACATTNTAGSDPLACQPGCDGGQLCCPWSSTGCGGDAGCGPRSGYVCADVDQSSGCPALQFSGQFAGARDGG